MNTWKRKQIYQGTNEVEKGILKLEILIGLIEYSTYQLGSRIHWVCPRNKIVKIVLEGGMSTMDSVVGHWKMIMLGNQVIKLVKVQWKHFGLDEFIWEIV